MSSEKDTFVIVGAGLAGAKATETLRAEGFAGRVLLVGAEAERPYERPPLSKDYLAGTVDRESIYVHEPGWYDGHGIELRPGIRAQRLDPGAHRVELDTGEHVEYQKLLLATGSTARRLPVPGADLDGVHYLRTAADSDRLRTALSGGGRQVVVVGAGWIGLEAAAAARGYGKHRDRGGTPAHTAVSGVGPGDGRRVRPAAPRPRRRPAAAHHRPRDPRRRRPRRIRGDRSRRRATR